MYSQLFSSDTPQVTLQSLPTSLWHSSFKFNSKMVYSLGAFVLSALSLGALRAFGFDISRSDNVCPSFIFAHVSSD